MAFWSDLKPSSVRFLQQYSFPQVELPVLSFLNKDLASCRMALVTTAGLHLHSDPPFSRDFWASDCSYRSLPADARLQDLTISHHSGEFDKTSIKQDLNVVYPIDRLNELAALRRIGSVAGTHYSFMGAIPDPQLITSKYAPEVAQKLTQDQVDVVLLTPV